VTTTSEHASIRRVVTVTAILGAAASSLVVALGNTVWSGDVPLLDTLPYGLPLFLGLTLVGQLVYVKVRHAATTEELGFLEVVLAAAILTLEPTAALVATMLGMLIGEFVIRRPPIKLAYNLGMYAASTSVMIITYHVLFPGVLTSIDGGEPGRFSWQSIASLLLASMAALTPSIGAPKPIL
jgi:hypothetical protein